MALARQIRNPGARGQNARYDISGLTRGERGWTDGTYWYDDNGLSLDRPDSYVQGLKAADEMDSEGGGGGGGGGSIPGAALYARALAEAKKRYQTRLADLNKQRQSTFRQSGFKGDIDPESGLVKNLAVDPYNQYGTFQMLNRAQAQRGEQGRDENIARGLGTGGGLAAQRMNELRFGFGQEDAQFGAGLTDQLGAFDRQQQDYKYEYDQTLWQAELEAARLAMEQADYGYWGGGGDEDAGGSADPYGTQGVTDLINQNIGNLPPNWVGKAFGQKPVRRRKPKARGAGGGSPYRTM